MSPENIELLKVIVPSVCGGAALVWCEIIRRQGNVNHKQMNSRLTELLETAKQLARAEGVAEGKAQERGKKK